MPQFSIWKPFPMEPYQIRLRQISQEPSFVFAKGHPHGYQSDEIVLRVACFHYFTISNPKMRDAKSVV